MKSVLFVLMIVSLSLFVVGCGDTNDVDESSFVVDEVSPVSDESVENVVDELLVDESDDVTIGELI